MPLLPILLLFVSSLHAMEMRPEEPEPTAAEEPEAVEPADVFPDSVWMVTNLDGSAPLPDHPITFAIHAGGQIDGNASCNRFGGTGEFDETTVKIGPLRTTRRFCEPDIMEQEQKFLALLQAATHWHIEDNTLTLFSPEGQILAALQSPPPQEE